MGIYSVIFTKESCYTIVLSNALIFILFKNSIYLMDSWLLAKNWNEVGFWQN